MHYRLFSATSLVCSSAAFLASVLLSAGTGSQAQAADAQAAAPAHQVVACYFHRTVRCPTCKKISAYIEQSVHTKYGDQLKDGSVKMVMIDFQDPANEKLTQAYKITKPTLVIMDVQEGKVAAWKPAPKVWSLVGKKNDFFQYVQSEIQVYLDGKRVASR